MTRLTDVSTVILGAEEGFGPSIANGGWQQSYDGELMDLKLGNFSPSALF